MENKAIWTPIPGSSQELALDSRCQATLYTGTRGPGKTDTQLMMFRKHVGIGYGPFWRGVIFDREYKNLDDLVAKAKRWFYAFGDGARWLSSKADYKWVWPTGEELLFRAIKKNEDYWNYHGQEFPFIGWNELTKFPTSELYDMMMSTNRSSFTPEKDNSDLPNIPLILFSTTNPWGPGHNWVKERFIDKAPYGKVVKTECEVFNPRTQRDEVITTKSVAIFGSYRENIYLDPLYVSTLNSILDENLKDAWLRGSWDVESGGALDGVWNKNVHVVPRFKIPKEWKQIDRSFDWGSTHPFSVGWWAVANGEEVILPNGTVFCPKAGSLIQFFEYYGTKKIGTNKGIKLSATEIAENIKNIESELVSSGWVSKTPAPGPADNQIGDTTQIDVETIASKMESVGIYWEKSDKRPGSRKIGLQILRDRLEAALKNEENAIYFMDNCLASRTTLPNLPRDPDDLDDVDSSSEDHPYDMIRYRCLAGNNKLATNIKIKFPN